VLGADLVDGELSTARVRDAVASAVAALEIVDSRVAGWDISIADTVADNASSGRFVLGGERVGGMTPTRVAIIGSGNIGTDLMMKVKRLSPSLELAAMVGIDSTSDGLARAARWGVATTADGVRHVGGHGADHVLNA
jgi:2-keto-4-pentenoate hydratase